jgi:hypothetical protein
MPADEMSKEAEAQLVGALSDVADHVNAGSTPNEAIIKAARDHQVPAGHINLMVNSYNIGRTTRQRQDGDGAFTKAADFVLADAAAILEELFPENVKAAAYREPVSDVYSRPPGDLLARRAMLRKQAAGPRPLVLTDKAVAPLAVDPAHAGMKLAADEHRVERFVAETRMEVSAAADRLVGLIKRAREYFLTPGSLRIPEVLPNVGALYGSAGVAVLDQLCRGSGVLQKQASLKIAPGLHRADSEPIYALIGECIDAGHDLIRKRANFAELEALAKVGETKPSLGPSILDRPSRFAKQANAGLADKAVNSLIYNGISDMYQGMKPDRPTDQASMVQKQLGRVATPEHNQALEGIRTQALMHEMLADDDVLSGYDPRQVTGAYNRIVQFAPGVAAQPLTAIPLVRKSLAQGSLDTFDAKEVADTEHKYQQSRAPQS